MCKLGIMTGLHHLTHSLTYLHPHITRRHRYWQPFIKQTQLMNYSWIHTVVIGVTDRQANRLLLLLLIDCYYVLHALYDDTLICHFLILAYFWENERKGRHYSECCYTVKELYKVWVSPRSVEWLILNLMLIKRPLKLLKNPGVNAVKFKFTKGTKLLLLQNENLRIVLVNFFCKLLHFFLSALVFYILLWRWWLVCSLQFTSYCYYYYYY